MMHIKTVRVTNPKNVLVQIPGYVIAQWQANADSLLEVYYNDNTKELTVRPAVQRRSNVT